MHCQEKIMYFSIQKNDSLNEYVNKCQLFLNKQVFRKNLQKKVATPAENKQKTMQKRKNILVTNISLSAFYIYF